MKKYTSWAVITLLLIGGLMFLGSCSSSGQHACPSRIEIMP